MIKTGVQLEQAEQNGDSDSLFNLCCVMWAHSMAAASKTNKRTKKTPLSSYCTHKGSSTEVRSDLLSVSLCSFLISQEGQSHQKEMKNKRYTPPLLKY